MRKGIRTYDIVDGMARLQYLNEGCLQVTVPDHATNDLITTLITIQESSHPSWPKRNRIINLQTVRMSAAITKPNATPMIVGAQFTISGADTVADLSTIIFKMASQTVEAVYLGKQKVIQQTPES